MLARAAVLAACSLRLAAAARRVNWYLSANELANNAALVARHGASLSGAYLCCGFGGVGADGAWASVATDTALAQQAVLTGAGREVWQVAGVAEAAVRSGAWAGAAGVRAAAAALAPLAAAGLTGIVVDYEPADNYTLAHAQAYGAYLGALAGALRPLGLAVGADIAGWGILGEAFWPAYLGRGLARVTSMTPTYNADNLTANRAFVRAAVAAFPDGAYAAGVGTVLAGGAACPMVYGWNETTFPPFVQWMAGAGVQTVDVWRCDIDRKYPEPDPTAPWYFDALAAFLAG